MTHSAMRCTDDGRSCPVQKVGRSGQLEDRDGCDNPAMSLQDAIAAPNVQAQLSVRNGRAAVDFYKAAFGAVEVYRFGGTDDRQEVVAQLAVGNSLFWVEDESPPHGNFSPQTVGGATVRVLLIVDDPQWVLGRAVAAGASQVSPVCEEHGWQLGRIDDPFGHRWEIGRPLLEWPPPQGHPSSEQSTVRQ
jgi:PhnB protein